MYTTVVSGTKLINRADLFLYFGVGKSPTPLPIILKIKPHFMKPSKVFLSLTASLLAIIGYSAKKNHFTRITAAYYTGIQGISLYITTHNIGATITAQGSQLQTFYGIHIPPHARYLFTADQCVQPLFPRAD
jgi:hypothetical protein